LEDNAVDLANEIGGLLGERIGRTQETYLTTGTGSSQPGGVVTGSTLGVTAASAAAIAADELISLLHSVDPAYRRDPSCGFMMHDNIAAAVRKLKDSQNRYLWDMDALKNGQPAMLLGKPVTINQSMQSSIATGTKTVLFGAYKKFKIRDVKAIRIRRLTERYADADQEGFIAFMRTDAKLLNAGTNPIKHLIQA
jgi:HK97 family phage major capsid protein